MPSPSTNHNPFPPPTWVRWLWETPWLWLAVIIAFFCVPLFIGLDRIDLENDEAIYSFAVETMLQDGEWLTPKGIPSRSVPFLEKPPLKIWITTVPIRLGLLPENEFGLRFMDAAMGALAFLYVFGIGRKLAGPVCGLVAVLLLYSHHALIYLHGVRSNNMESAMVLAYAAAVYHFLAWRSINPDVKRHVYAMSLWFVVGFMTKFVAALFLPVILAVAALIKREDRGRLYRDWPTFAGAAALAVALIAPWFLYQYFQRGPVVFETMFGTHVFKRFTAYLDPAHLHPWHYYLTQLWAELNRSGAQILVSIAAVLFVARVWFRRWIEGLVVVLWFVIPIAAISTGTSKIYHYAYPFIAPVALAGGWLVAVVAARIYALLAKPVAAATRARDSVLPAALRFPRVQLGFTIAGLAALAIAMATWVFGRLSATIAGLSIRNSSVERPSLVAAICLALAVPPHVLRALATGAILLVALPVSAYRSNFAETRRLDQVGIATRACVLPIVTELVAAGRRPPGTWVETADISWPPMYYLAGAGSWRVASPYSDATVVRRLLSDRPGPVLLSEDRYRELLVKLAADRAVILRNAAEMEGTDPSNFEAALERAVGLTPFFDNILLLPGPFEVCGQTRVRLISR